MVKGNKEKIMIPATHLLNTGNTFAQNPLADHNNLINAISNGDLGTVQRMLAYCDGGGVPYVDLNRGYGNAPTALMWALWENPINEDIIGVLLDARNHAHYPIIELNRRGPHGQTIFSFILSIPDARLRR